jgi:short-subunit dehydrogenase
MKSEKYLNFWKQYGPYALVAGSGGLGAAFAEALARRGLNLVLAAFNKESLAETAKKLKEKYKVEVITLGVDPADFENFKNVLTGLDVSIGLLIYNSAFASSGLFENTGEEHLSQAANANVRTPLLLAKFLSAQMIKNEKGGIVLMSALEDVRDVSGLAVYRAVKSFNTGLAKGLYRELRPYGVNIIACSADISEKTRHDKIVENIFKKMGKKAVIVM